MKVENLVDVFLKVRSVRIQNPLIVQTVVSLFSKVNVSRDWIQIVFCIVGSVQVDIRSCSGIHGWFWHVC